MFLMSHSVVIFYNLSGPFLTLFQHEIDLVTHVIYLNLSFPDINMSS
jgi:hypothetical protein